MPEDEVKVEDLDQSMVVEEIKATFSTNQDDGTFGGNLKPHHISWLRFCGYLDNPPSWAPESVHGVLSEKAVEFFEFDSDWGYAISLDEFSEDDKEILHPKSQREKESEDS